MVIYDSGQIPILVRELARRLAFSFNTQTKICL